MSRLAPYYALLGELIVSWNRAENMLSMVLTAICGGGSPLVWILTSDLGAVSLENALKSATADLAAEELKDSIYHMVEWFSRLREFRNYYIHGVQRVIKGETGLIGLIGQRSAKSVLAFHE